jgi:hypothetical protein
MGRIRRSMAVTLAAIVVASCGGGSAPTFAPQPRQFAAPPPLDATALMDWAERTYPAYFPTHGTNLPATVGPDVYTYRSYQVNGQTNLLGVTTDGRIDVLLPDVTGPAPVTVGTLAAFTCRVLPQNCVASVIGTAATGGPLAGVTVRLKDSLGNSVVATTSAAGAYSLNTAGLSGPFLLQATTPGGATLYGVSADLAPATIANLTPLTDLIVRSWYSLRGVAPETAFANPPGAPAPTMEQVSTVAGSVLAIMQLALDSANAGITAPLQLIEQPFAANHTGLDAVLDATSVVYGSGATVSTAAGATHQTSTISYDSASGTMTAASTATNAGSSSSSVVTTVVVVDPAGLDALSGIAAVMNSLAAVVNSRGASLTVADVMPFLAPGLIDDGLNRDQFAADTVSGLGQGQVAFAVQGFTSLDLAAGRAEVALLVTQSMGGQSSTEANTFWFQQVNGAWLLAGNNRVARISLYAEARTDQGALSSGSYQAINADVRAPQGSVSSVRVVAGAGTLTLNPGPTVIDDSGAFLDSFLGNTGPLPAGSLPAAGTVYAVTLSRSSGDAIVDVPINAFTNEPVPLVTPTGSTLADAHLGGTLDVSWHLPMTYAVREIRLSALVFTGAQDSQDTFQCEAPQSVVASTATAGTVNVPALCNGKSVTSVNVNLSINGVNGERSQTIYMLK